MNESIKNLLIFAFVFKSIEWKSMTSNYNLDFDFNKNFQKVGAKIKKVLLYMKEHPQYESLKEDIEDLLIVMEDSKFIEKVLPILYKESLDRINKSLELNKSKKLSGE
jgi:hypothetical protein